VVLNIAFYGVHEEDPLFVQLGDVEWFCQLKGRAGPLQTLLFLLPPPTQISTVPTMPVPSRPTTFAADMLDIIRDLGPVHPASPAFLTTSYPQTRASTPLIHMRILGAKLGLYNLKDKRWHALDAEASVKGVHKIVGAVLDAYGLTGNCGGQDFATNDNGVPITTRTLVQGAKLSRCKVFPGEDKVDLVIRGTGPSFEVPEEGEGTGWCNVASFIGIIDSWDGRLEESVEEVVYEQGILARYVLFISHPLNSSHTHQFNGMQRDIHCPTKPHLPTHRSPQPHSRHTPSHPLRPHWGFLFPPHQYPCRPLHLRTHPAWTCVS